MRFLAVVLVLAACDLKPAPKQGPPTPPAPAAAVQNGGEPPPGPPPGAPADAPAAPVAPPGPDAAIPQVRSLPDALIPVTAACVEVGVRVAEMLLKEASDPAQKAVLEQEKTRTVRATAEACTRDAWSDAARKCFMDAKNSAQMQVCGTNLRAP